MATTRLTGWLDRTLTRVDERTEALATGEVTDENVADYRARTARIAEKAAVGLLAVREAPDESRRRFDTAMELHGGAAEAGTDPLAERYYALRAGTLAGAKQAVPGLARRLKRTADGTPLYALDERGSLDRDYYLALAAGALGDAPAADRAAGRFSASVLRLATAGFFETTTREERALYGGRSAVVEGVLSRDAEAVARGLETVLAHHDGSAGGAPTELPCREATFLATVATAAGLGEAVPDHEAVADPLVDARALPDGPRPV
ncbi:hypothetical protein [Halosegnis sp.]|uniref:hypothetical protein n=1 Tax=Halosegnis sp. TaxID=2864959 RepID=UPI0035D4DCA7